jgi:hypothetical protein
VSLEAFVLFAFPLFGTPFVVGLAWWAWSRTSATHLSRLRAAVSLIGLGAVSADAAVYYGWFAYRVVSDGSPSAWEMKAVLADNITISVAMFALFCGTAGKGFVRILVVLLALMEVVLWSNFGIL